MWGNRNFDIVKQNEHNLLDEEGFSKRGHNIPCRFCGQLSADHAVRDHYELTDQEPKDEWMVRLRGQRTNLVECPGYVPKNVREWDRLEKEFQKSKANRF